MKYNTAKPFVVLVVLPAEWQIDQRHIAGKNTHPHKITLHQKKKINEAKTIWFSKKTPHHLNVNSIFR